jgi:hypothetical protein
VDWIDAVNKLLEAGFYIVIGIVTLLVYLKAKQTLLQPIRTEVFKEQLRTINELSSHFVTKLELDLRHDLDFERLIQINCVKLLDMYASLFFDLKIDEGKRPYSINYCPVMVVSADQLRLADDYLLPEPSTPPESPAPSTKASIWAGYKFDAVSLTKTHHDAFQNLQRLSQSALLPKECGKLVSEYLRAVEDNIHLISQVLTEASKELPEKYPNLLVMKRRATFSWIENKYVERFKALKPLADHIEAWLRKYLSTDTLLSA